MGSIRTRKQARSTVVMIDYMNGAQRVRESIQRVRREGNPAFRSELAAAKARARAILTKREAAAVEGRHRLHRPTRATFAEFVEAAYIPALRTRARNRSLAMETARVTTGPLGRIFGPLRLVDITTDTVSRYVQARLDGTIPDVRAVGPATVNRDLERLRNVLNVARERAALPKDADNPVSVHGMLREPEGRVRWLEPAEEDRLVDALGGPHAALLRDFMRLAFRTGARRGTLKGLRWQHVDLERELIRVPAALNKGGRAYTITLNADALAILRRLASRDHATGPMDRVFTLASGRPLGDFKKTWATACKRAKLADFRFHDCRHTFASRLAMAGCTTFEIAAALGQSTAAMAERYSHLSPDHMRKVAEAAQPNRPALRAVGR